MLIVSDRAFMESYLIEQFKPSYDVRLLHVDDLQHVASLSRHYDTVIYSPVAAASNISHIHRLCDAMDTDTPENLIFISSYEVYGFEAYRGMTVTERDVPHPDSPYGRDLLECERHLIEWTKTHHPTSLTILRPGEIIGNGMTGRIRKMTDRIANGIYMHLPDYDGTISLIHAEDLAKVASCLHGKCGIFNINDGCMHRRREVADAIAHRLNDKRIFVLPRKSVALLKLISHMAPSIKKSLAAMSYEATYDIAAMTAATDNCFTPRDVLAYLNSKS